MKQFEQKLNDLFARHEELITRKNEPMEEGNGVYTRYKNPVLTAAHTPVFWRYDLNEETNPYLMERNECHNEFRRNQVEWKILACCEGRRSRQEIILCCG